MGIEEQRNLELHPPDALQDKLLIRKFHGSEQLGACFEYVLLLYSDNQDVDPNDLLGEHVSIRVKCGEQPKRYIDGIVCEFGHIGSKDKVARYRMVLRPWLWLLSTRSDCRIFQNKNTVEIVRDVIDTWSDAEFQLEVRVSEPPPERPYCVQYAESDLSFVMRLLEDDGLYFFFEHDLKKHKLIIADAKSAHKPAKGFEKLKLRSWDTDRTDAASVWNWTSRAAVRPGGLAMRDYDFEKPRADIDIDLKQPMTKHPRDKTAVIYEYPGHYVEAEAGSKRGHLRLEELQADFDTAECTTDASAINAGTLFTLEEHDRKAENREYLVTSVVYQADSGAHYSGDSGSADFSIKVHCMPTKQPYRPHRKTPWPVVPGAQTATVVGHEEGEVATDKFARVRVHFPWNRARRPNKSAHPPDKHTSCWVRVAQSWTGSGWGALFIPRVGQEVVVEFLDGNPDRPLITGCVYNNRNKPPYELPAKASQSGWKTRSLKHGDANEYNELRFDDDKGHEEIVIQAQRDMKTTVKNDASKSVGHDETHTVGNKLAVTVDKDVYTIDVKEKLMKVCVHNDTHSTRAEGIYGDAAKEIKLQIENSPVSLTMNANSITLKVGPTSISLTPESIDIHAPVAVTVKGNTVVDIGGLEINLNSNA
jgi:type VI secretion system secreted protein VgrG